MRIFHTGMAFEVLCIATNSKRQPQQRTQKKKSSRGMRIKSVTLKLNVPLTMWIGHKSGSVYSAVFFPIHLSPYSVFVPNILILSPAEHFFAFKWANRKYFQAVGRVQRKWLISHCDLLNRFVHRKNEASCLLWWIFQLYCLFLFPTLLISLNLALLRKRTIFQVVTWTLILYVRVLFILAAWRR